MTNTHTNEIAQGERFAFGANWADFLQQMDDSRIAEAEGSLRTMLEKQNLQGLRFLDIGSGSGLFSLAARRLGANVRSFDYDPQSVACTRGLRARDDDADAGWVVEEGSVLDSAYMSQLGTFDIVYSWGVLHHTGAMWHAIGQAAERVAPGGLLFIAIYNDQGRASRMWLRTKKAYNALPTSLRDLLAGRPGATWRGFKRNRGMHPWRDVVDWVGGLPFEVAKPEQIFEFLKTRGFRLQRLVTCAGGHGCNEFVFVRDAESSISA